MSDENKRIDDDWKRRAVEEKQKIASQMGGILEESSEGGEKKAIESDPRFPGLIQQIAYPALMALGQIPDPRTGERMLDLTLPVKPSICWEFSRAKQWVIDRKKKRA